MLAFMRHGETDWNRAQRFQGRTDIPLNDTGRRQAREAAQKMAEAGEPWDLVVTSPLSRARETGRIVADTLGIELGGTDDELIERSFGATEGASNEDLSARDYDELMLAAEPEEQVWDRTIRATTRIARQHPGRNVLLVAHGSLIRITLSHWMREAHPRISNTQVLLVEDRWLAMEGTEGTEAAEGAESAEELEEAGAQPGPRPRQHA